MNSNGNILSVLFGGHETQECSGSLPLGLGTTWCQGLNTGWQCERQAPYPLYFSLSQQSTLLSINMIKFKYFKHKLSGFFIYLNNLNFLINLSNCSFFPPLIISCYNTSNFQKSHLQVSHLNYLPILTNVTLYYKL